ncbi:MAG: Uma2 family endonuclease [Planctomycetes bacterium]|nr:Uma2 family endonuclease [Planctomycetota bacterium]
MISTMKTDIAELDAAPEKNAIGAPKLQPRYTVDEYLTLERAADERHIYLDGEVIAMAGESGAHADISVNVVASLANQLKGTQCRARTKETKVRSGPIPEKGHCKKGMFSYPDIVVVCGEIEYHDAHRDVILNPKVIIEILSESTEALDRDEKFQRYQAQNPTLTDYILISQTKPLVEHFRRKPRGRWSYDSYSGIEASLPIASIACALKLADVYDRVSFASSAD